MKKVAIVQSSYIPWKGYFDLINIVDEFILYDDAQYTKGDWRNRNKIKIPKGTTWLTIPIKNKGQSGQKIREAQVADHGWASKHWKVIKYNYSKAPYFEEISPNLEILYKECSRETYLSKINYRFLKAIVDMIGIDTCISWSMDYEYGGDRTEALVALCQQVGAGEYLSGPAAKNYLDEKRFELAGIQVCWMDYGGYPAYCQLYSPPFIHEVSIIDLLMNEGCEGAREHMLSFKD
ncbi:MAG: WbqC family protein [Nitrospirales bacterium]